MFIILGKKKFEKMLSDFQTDFLRELESSVSGIEDAVWDSATEAVRNADVEIDTDSITDNIDTSLDNVYSEIEKDISNLSSYVETCVSNAETRIMKYLKKALDKDSTDTQGSQETADND